MQIKNESPAQLILCFDETKMDLKPLIMLF